MKFDVAVIEGPFDNLSHFILIKSDKSIIMLSSTIAKGLGIPEREFVDRIANKVISNEEISATKSIFYFKKELTDEQYIENFKNEFVKELTMLNLK